METPSRTFDAAQRVDKETFDLAFEIAGHTINGCEPVIRHSYISEVECLHGVREVGRAHWFSYEAKGTGLCTVKLCDRHHKTFLEYDRVMHQRRQTKALETIAIGIRALVAQGDRKILEETILERPKG